MSYVFDDVYSGDTQLGYQHWSILTAFKQDDQ